MTMENQGCTGWGDSGARRSSRAVGDAAVHAPHASDAGVRDRVAGTDGESRRRWRDTGDGVERLAEVLEHKEVNWR